MLPGEVFEIKKRLLTLSFAKLRYNTEPVFFFFLNFELFMEMCITLLVHFVKKKVL